MCFFCALQTKVGHSLHGDLFMFVDGPCLVVYTTTLTTAAVVVVVLSVCLGRGERMFANIVLVRARYGTPRGADGAVTLATGGTTFALGICMVKIRYSPRDPRGVCTGVAHTRYNGVRSYILFKGHAEPQPAVHTPRCLWVVFVLSSWN